VISSNGQSLQSWDIYSVLLEDSTHLMHLITKKSRKNVILFYIRTETEPTSKKLIAQHYCIWLVGDMFLRGSELSSTAYAWACQPSSLSFDNSDKRLVLKTQRKMHVIVWQVPRKVVLWRPHCRCFCCGLFPSRKYDWYL
jgi:hypothetical protein